MPTEPPPAPPTATTTAPATIATPAPLQAPTSSLPPPPTVHAQYWNSGNWYQGMPYSQVQRPTPVFVQREQAAYMNMPPAYSAYYNQYAPQQPPPWSFETPPTLQTETTRQQSWSTAADPATPPNSDHLTLSVRTTPQSGGTVVITDSTPEQEGASLERGREEDE